MKMKIWHSVFALGMMTAALSTDVSAYGNYRSGFYGGVEGGWLHEKHHYKINDQIPGLINDNLNKSKDSDKFLPGVFLGYRHFIQCYYLGAEVDGLINKSSTKVRFTTFLPGNDQAFNRSTHRIKGKYNIIPALLFGREFMDKFSIYGKMGVDFGKYRYRLKDTTPFKKSKGLSLNRFLLGGGAEYAFNSTWSTRLEVNYSFSKSKKEKIKDKDSGHIYTSRLKVASTAVKVGVFVRI